MPKKALQITCGAAERKVLEQLAFNRKETQATSERAQMVLGCLDGKQVSEIAQAFRTRPNTVIKWRNRFVHQGAAGLHDAPRPGPPHVYGEAFRQRILALLATTPPASLSNWDGLSVAAILKCPPHAVWRILRKEGISLQRRRSWRIATEDRFAPKTIGLMGLFLDPPFNALALRVEPVSNRASSSNPAGWVFTDNGKTAHRLTSAGRRKGVLNLSEALRVGTDQATATMTEQHRRESFPAFLEQLATGAPLHGEIHLLLDPSFSVHPHQAWLARHAGKWICHIMPPTPGWLQQIEIWLAMLLGPDLIDSADTAAVELKQAILDFTTAYGPHSKPFHWCQAEAK